MRPDLTSRRTQAQVRESRPVSGGVCSLSRTASEIATVEPNLKKRCLLSVWTEGRVSGSTKTVCS